ncbi:MAG: hypothetical protein JF591_12030 [Lysobacter sp.]|nr:hypothetical protein [Lysobacter sp.]
MRIDAVASGTATHSKLIDAMVMHSCVADRLSRSRTPCFAASDRQRRIIPIASADDVAYPQHQSIKLGTHAQSRRG